MCSTRNDRETVRMDHNEKGLNTEFIYIQILDVFSSFCAKSKLIFILHPSQSLPIPSRQFSALSFLL